MNILNFDRWIISEGIDVKVSSDDNETKDDITIDDTTYSIDDDGKVTQNDNQEIDDESLKDDVKNASDAINILKKTERHVELRRITGGDKHSIKNDINQYLKNGKKIMRDETLMSNPKINDFFTNKSEPYIYVNIDYIHYIENNLKDDIIKIYNTSPRGIGKGEYFLPLMFHDVYKKQAYVEIGDNYIVTNNGEYNLELKGSNINLKFDKDSKNKIKESNKKSEIIKDAITTSFLKYAIKQSEKRKNLYMCIFDVVDYFTDNKEPKGMLLIDISNLGNTHINKIKDLPLFQTLREMITIVESKTNIPRDGYDFKYNIKKKGNKIKIECILNEQYLKESIILSRDNFVNKIYTK